MPLPVILGGGAVVTLLSEFMAAIGLRAAGAALVEYAGLAAVRVTAAAGWARNVAQKWPKSTLVVLSFTPFEQLWNAAGMAYTEAQHYAHKSVDEALAYWVEAVVGSAPKSWDKEGLLHWAGKIAAAKVNAQTGWKFSSLYPPEKIGQEVAAMVGGGLINGTGMVGGFQVMARSQAATHAVAIKNKALEEYGEGNKRKTAAQNAKQKLWRNAHPQIIVPSSGLNMRKQYITNKAIAKMVARKTLLSWRRRLAEINITIANISAKLAAGGDAERVKLLNWRMGRKLDERAYVRRQLTTATAAAVKLGVAN